MNNDKKIIHDNIDLIKNMYFVELKTISNICERFNVKFHNVRSYFKDNDISVRSHSENQKIIMNKPDVKKKISIATKNSQSKRKETNLKKYGSEVPANKINWQDGYEKKHGVKHPNQRSEIKLNMSLNNPAKTDEVKKKIKQNRWVNKTKMELKEIQNKTKETWLKNYGYDNPLKSNLIKEKIKKTTFKRYGCNHVSQYPEIQKRIFDSHVLNIKDKMIEKLKILNLELVNEYTGVTVPVKLKCIKCNTIFTTVLDYVFHDYGLCPVCFPKSISKPEQQIRDFIEQHINKENILYNDRIILDGLELDIFIKDKNIAIEHNGLYYHSDVFDITNNYHLNKTKLALDKGIRLIHIFEDEWSLKGEIVKSRLKRILNINNKPKINLTNCVIKEINNQQKNLFLDTFHLEGHDDSNINLGLFFENQLISVITFLKLNEKDWLLNRFCTNYNFLVPGVLNEFINYFKKNQKWSKIFKFCDRRWSIGKSYQEEGFELEETTSPDFWYVKSIQRIHKSNLKENNDYNKIWDCGKLKFVLKNF